MKLLSNLIFLSILSIFYPFYSSKIILPISIYIIYFSFFVFIGKKVIPLNILFITLFGFMIITFLSSFMTESIYYSTAIKRAFTITGAVILFIMITSFISKLDNNSKMNFLLKLLKLVLILLMIEVIYGLISLIYPNILNITFLFTGGEPRESYGSEYFIRLTGIFLTPESAGEILATILPLNFAIYIYSKDRTFLFSAIVTLTGLMLTLTRSAIFLGLIGLIFFAIIGLRGKYRMKIVYFVSFIFLVSPIILFLFPSLLQDIVYRFNITLDNFFISGLTLDTINRGMFENAYFYVLNNINVLGHGMVTIVPTGVLHLHNLYLTLLFQLGIIGLILFLFFLLQVFVVNIKALKKIKNDKNKKMIIVAILIGLMVFCLNEFKFEFMRHSSYQYLTFVILSIFYNIPICFIEANKIRTL